MQSDAIVSVPGKRYVVPEPNSLPQRDFFLSDARFVGYGGARGGGKSWALRNKFALLAFNYAGIRMLLLRRTYPELQENHILPMRKMLNGFATYNATDRRFLFPNGSSIRFGYCDNEADVLRYQGQEYDVIGIDEATHFTEYQYEALLACLRGVNEFPRRMYLTGNPGGVGHGWFKRLFISREYRETESPENYVFIPAKVYDNVDLMREDPEYLKMLENLPPDTRRAWLEGDWDVFSGQYFTEWRRDVHVIEPFIIPAHWRRYFAMDYGMDMLAGYWVALDESGGAWVYREIYEGRDNNKGANGGGLLMSEAAARIAEMTPPGEKIEAWFAPPDLWNRRQDTGRSAAEAFALAGVPLSVANNNRVQGWMELKEWLRPVQGIDGEYTPRLQVFAGCVGLIESMPNLVCDKRDQNDCAREPHKYTHAPDALRYFVAGRPWAAASLKGAVEDEEPRARWDDQMDSFVNFGR